MPRLFGSTLDRCSVNQTLHTAASFGIINLTYFEAIRQNDFRVGQPWRTLYFPGQTLQGTSSYLCGKVWNSPFTVAGRKATNRPYL